MLAGGMYRLRSIDPVSGYVRQFDLKDDGPLLIGRLSAEGAIESLPVLLSKAPEPFKQATSDLIRSTRYTITMQECRIDHRRISRAHCMVFPGPQFQIVDLFSTNGTVLAREEAGIVLVPTEMTDLRPGDLILLAKGTALFEYAGTLPGGDESVLSSV
jgi:hypothetical protein